MLRHRIIPCLSAVALSLLFATVSASPSAQTEAVKYIDLATVPLTTLGKLRAKGFVGRSGSFVTAQLPPGYRGTPHHHTHEQITIGLTGSIEVSIGGVVNPLGEFGATIVPSNSQHFIANSDSTAIATGIEFQPVLRPDWFPPYPKVTLPASSEPVPVPPERVVVTDLAPSSGGWQVAVSGARSKTLAGETCGATMWHLSTPNASAELTAKSARSERFVYVLAGQAEMTVGRAGRKVGAEMLAVVSSGAEGIRLRSIGTERPLILVFESYGN